MTKEVYRLSPLTHSPPLPPMIKTSNKNWQFWIDRGGTFTDVVAKRPDGQIVIHKLLSENPEHYQDAEVQ